MTNPDYMYVTVIAASREKVWEGLTTAEFTAQYWHATRVRSDWQVGSQVAFMVDGDDGEEVGCAGEVLKCEPFSKLSYTWSFPRDPSVRDEPPSRVTFTLEDMGGHTRLTVIHDRFPEDSKMFGMVSAGWPCVIAGLKTLLETGNAVDFSQYMTKAANA